MAGVMGSGSMQPGGGEQLQGGQGEAPAPGERPPPDEQEKAHAKTLLGRVDSALRRPAIKKAFDAFPKQRKLLAGQDPDNEGKKLRTNLFFANLAMIRPQIYAKDPEYSVTPTPAVSEAQLEAVKGFCGAAEAVLHEALVKRAKLKRRAKRMITSTFTTGVGWLKAIWQEDKRQDPLIANQIKDTQDNLLRIEQLRREVEDPQAGTDLDAKLAELRQTLEGLMGQAELTVARGLALDFVLSEDIIILDPSVLELADYERASGIAHRIWMTHEKFEQTFGYKCSKAKTYVERSAGQMAAQEAGGDKANELLCVYEIWEQASNRLFHVCDGMEGYCRPPQTPDWTGARWYPFFLLQYNETEELYPLSDVDLIEGLVREYNRNRDDFVRDREDSLPFTVVRKGGSLTDADVTTIRNRKGNDVIMVEGVGNNPISNDMQSITLGTIDPNNYTTDPARSDIEQLIGGGDAARGTVMKAKTATEAEIMAQGLRGRSADRQDTQEEMLSELGNFCLQVCLRKLTPEEVAEIAGEDAAQYWPSLTAEEVFKMVQVEVRGGSTGKPDRLQEQDRWTKLQPVIEKTVLTVSELYEKGQVRLGQALVAMLRETMRRFDERIDLNEYLPEEPKEGSGADAEGQPGQIAPELQQQVQALMEENEALQQQLQQAQSSNVAAVEKARQDAQAKVEVARITAPLEAQAAVEVARIKETAQAASAMHATEQQAQADTAMKGVQEQLGALLEMQQTIAQLMQAIGQPKPRSKVVHRYDDFTGALLESRQVPDED